MRVHVGGVGFHNLTMQEAVARIILMTQKTEAARYVCTGNLDHLCQLEQDAAFRAIYDKADLVLADGAPVVWLSHLSRTGPLCERVAGSDLFWELSRAAAATGTRLFFLGGSEGSAAAAADAVRKRFPGVQICGTYCPPFDVFGTPEEETRIQRLIRDAAPDILFVGLGAPKQEKWIAANKNLIGVPVSIGVGGSFEMACGIARRAPVWMQKSGLEWSYRLAQEPKRLWNRYMGRDLPYLIRLFVTMALARVRPDDGNRQTTEEIKGI